MLIYNYEARNHNITASVLAEKMGFSGYPAANLQYGTLAGQIASTLKIKSLPEQKINILVTFEKPDDEWHWIMRPSLARALESLGWVQVSPFLFPEEIDTSEKIYEGATYEITINKYERNPEARTKCIAKYGHTCQACGVNLYDVYGPAAKGFIHVHHLTPLASISKKYQVNPEKDLVPVCPNCHAIIHLSTPPYTIKEIKQMLDKKRRR